MIAHLRGAIIDKHPNQVVLDVGGDGPKLAITVLSGLPTAELIAANVGIQTTAMRVTQPNAAATRESA